MAAFQVLDYCADKLSSSSSSCNKSDETSAGVGKDSNVSKPASTKTIAPQVMFGLSNDV
jgi:hypothetical protein